MVTSVGFGSSWDQKGITGVIGPFDNIKTFPVRYYDGWSVVRAFLYIYLQKSFYLYSLNHSIGMDIKVVNCSFGWTYPLLPIPYTDPHYDNPIIPAIINEMGLYGILTVVATDNYEDRDVDPSNDIFTSYESPYLISVTSTTNTDEKAPGAAYGQISIDLGAPGEYIRTIKPVPSSPNATYDTYSKGTSFAVPHVSATLGLMYTAMSDNLKNEYEGRDDELAILMKQLLLDGVDEIPALSVSMGSTTPVRTGGRLNAYKAVLNVINRGIPDSTRALTKEDILVTEPLKQLTTHNYPNPFNPETTICFTLPSDNMVNIDIYNIRGQKVRTLVDEWYVVGEHSVVWNGTDDHGRNIGSGIYLYRLKTKENIITRKMVLMK